MSYDQSIHIFSSTTLNDGNNNTSNKNIKNKKRHRKVYRESFICFCDPTATVKSSTERERKNFSNFIICNFIFLFPHSFLLLSRKMDEKIKFFIQFVILLEITSFQSAGKNLIHVRK
ncbi:hypothetical protein ACKWTF_009181 [Chironomus riparius]